MVLGISLTLNVLFIALWIYGMRLDRKIRKSRPVDKQVLTKLYYDYGRFYYE